MPFNIYMGSVAPEGLPGMLYDQQREDYLQRRDLALQEAELRVQEMNLRAAESQQSKWMTVENGLAEIGPDGTFRGFTENPYAERRTAKLAPPTYEEQMARIGAFATQNNLDITSVSSAADGTLTPSFKPKIAEDLVYGYSTPEEAMAKMKQLGVEVTDLKQDPKTGRWTPSFKVGREGQMDPNYKLALQLHEREVEAARKRALNQLDFRDAAEKPIPAYIDAGQAALGLAAQNIAASVEPRYTNQVVQTKAAVPRGLFHWRGSPAEYATNNVYAGLATNILSQPPAMNVRTNLAKEIAGIGAGTNMVGGATNQLSAVSGQSSGGGTNRPPLESFYR